MSVRRHVRFAACIGTAALSLGIASLPPATAAAAATSFAWVGSADGSGGDGHSWSDANNWMPKGVPGNGDSVSIAAAPGGLCTVDVDDVPSVRLRDLSIVHLASCHLTVRGGSITVLHALDWQGGTVDTHLVFASSAVGEIVGNGETGLTELDKDLVVQGTLDVRGFSVEAGPGAEISVESGGNLRLNQGMLLHAPADEGSPPILRIGAGGIVSATDEPRRGTATIAGFQVSDQGGTTSIAPGSRLRIVDGPRGSISDAAVIDGGGTLMLGDPTDSSDTTSILDQSRLVLLPGGSVDGTSGFAGDGSMVWRGGHLSGLDLGFRLSGGVTVSGPHPKFIDKEQGFFSNVEVLSDATFAAGTDEHHNLLTGGGGSFEVFDSTLTVRDNVEIRNAGLTESDFGNFIIDPGPGGTVYGGRRGFITASTELDVVSGTFISAEGFDMGLPDSAVVVEKGAVFRLPNQAHPLNFHGLLTGQGEIVGAVVNEVAGVFEPYNAGSTTPLRIHGSYTQRPGATLLLDLAKGSHPLRIGGFASVQGTVTYSNQPGYRPKIAAERRIINTTRSLSWSPDCEETTGEGSDAGHWVSAQLVTRATATFTSGSGGSC